MNQPAPCHLSHEKLLLLRAALLSGEPAAQAWQAWRATVDLDGLDAQSFALLPLLYRNLLAMNVADAAMGRLAGVARSAWASNQLIFRAGAGALAALQDAGVQALATDTTALILLHYGEGGMRRLHCFEALVRLRDVPLAMDALTDDGWRMETLHPPLDAVLAFRDSMLFHDHHGQPLRLAWRLWAQGDLDAETETWAASREISAGELRVRTLSPPDLLLRACSTPERLRLGQLPAWAADAWMAIHTAGGMDWERFVTQAQRFGLCLPAGDALECLRAVFNAVVPTEVVEQLRAARVSRMERTAWRARASGSTVWGRFSAALHRYRLLTRNQSRARRVGAFPAYLQCRWNLQSVWHVPGHALLRTAHAIRRRPNDA